MLHSHVPVRPPLTKKAAAFQYLRAIKGEKIKIRNVFSLKSDNIDKSV